MYAIAAGHDWCVELLSDTCAQANHRDKVRLCCTNEWSEMCVECWGWSMLVGWSHDVNVHSPLMTCVVQNTANDIHNTEGFITTNTQNNEH